MENDSHSHNFPPEKAGQWNRSSWSAPEVHMAPGDKEVVASTEKQIASDDGKQVAPGVAPETVVEENLPEAKDPEDEKEAMIWDYSSDGAAKPDPPLPIQWRKDKKVMLLLCAGTILLLVVAAALGAGLGVALHRSSGKQDSSSTASASAGGLTLVDAYAIAEPVSTSPPIGTRALTLSAARDSSATCLTRQEQQVAWDCNLVPDAHLDLKVDNSSVGLFGQVFYASDYTGISYGAQAPRMNTSLARLYTVVDETEEKDGIAFYFQHLYDKMVVVPETAITASKSKKLKRQPLDVLPNERLQERTRTTAGEKPWICVFNNTLLEAFIYINEPAQVSSTMTTAMSFSATTSSATSTSTSTSTTSIDTITTTTKHPSSTPTASSSSSSTWNLHWNSWTQLTTFSLLVKLGERRLADNAIQPYCQQIEILNNGSTNWVADSHGDPVIVKLEESAPHSSSASAGQACRCQWFSGES